MLNVLRIIMFGLLIVSLVGSGTTASMAFGACWIVGAALAVVKGMRAISTGSITVIPDYLGFQREEVHRHKMPTRFWLYVSLLFVLSVVAAGYGMYRLAGVW